jgi:hypothetical protein
MDPGWKHREAATLRNECLRPALKAFQKYFEAHKRKKKKTNIQQMRSYDLLVRRDAENPAEAPKKKRIKRIPGSINETMPVVSRHYAVTHIEVRN